MWFNAKHGKVKKQISLVDWVVGAECAVSSTHWDSTPAFPGAPRTMVTVAWTTRLFRRGWMVVASSKISEPVVEVSSGAIFLKNSTRATTLLLRIGCFLLMSGYSSSALGSTNNGSKYKSDPEACSLDWDRPDRRPTGLGIIALGHGPSGVRL